MTRYLAIEIKGKNKTKHVAHRDGKPTHILGRCCSGQKVHIATGIFATYCAQVLDRRIDHVYDLAELCVVCVRAAKKDGVEVKPYVNTHT